MLGTMFLKSKIDLIVEVIQQSERHFALSVMFRKDTSDVIVRIQLLASF